MPRSSLVISALVAVTLIAASAPHVWAPDLVTGETIRTAAAVEGSPLSVQIAGRSSAARTLARRGAVLVA
jgi:hypothetical protein